MSMLAIIALKYFQIGTLTFDDNMEITHMISDEDERVSLVRKINPQAANVLRVFN